MKSIRVRRKGFTLVEMLVVIVILSILAALLVPAIFWALNATKRAAVLLEISDLQQAIERYKNEVGAGDYPPNFDTQATVDGHLRRAFPRWVPTGSPADPSPTGLDAAEALVFWLRGFTADPTKPIGGSTETGRKALYDFDPTRLVDTDGDGYKTYAPRYCQGVPYVYIENRTYATTKWQKVAGQDTNEVRAYSSSATTGYANPTKFQIISCGLDGDFGSWNGITTKKFPSGENYKKGDRDNLANFSEGTLEDKIP